jgi:hypothetical protein
MTDVDAARLPLMLATLHLPTIGRHWQSFAASADAEGWGAARYLAALCEHELAERASAASPVICGIRLPAGKTSPPRFRRCAYRRRRNDGAGPKRCWIDGRQFALLRPRAWQDHAAAATATR